MNGNSPSPHDTPQPPVTGFVLGPFETNCYVVRSPTGPACWIVDAGFDPDQLIRHVRREELEPEAIVLTHAHVDHIAGLTMVRSAFPTAPIIVHEQESSWLNDPLLNLSQAIGMAVTAPGPDRTLSGGETLELDGCLWRVIHTPGHSPGGITLHHAESAQAIVGDSLFAGSIGRTDFPGSDHDTLIRCIRERLLTLPPETTVFPGHGPPTTVARERSSNPIVGE